MGAITALPFAVLRFPPTDVHPPMFVQHSADFDSTVAIRASLIARPNFMEIRRGIGGVQTSSREEEVVCYGTSFESETVASCSRKWIRSTVREKKEWRSTFTALSFVIVRVLGPCL